MMTSLNNFAGITLETDILIVTLQDNLSHTYCSAVSWEKDNITATGTARLIMPYSQSIESYWSKYSGAVVIHANINHYQPNVLNKKNKKVKKKKTKENKIKIENDKYNYSFIGKVHTFKQAGKNFVVYIEDLGWKFLQKVPDKFRDTYIAGQKLNDAFQAICEFMGIDFAYSIEELSKYNFSADGYSIEKDGKVIEDTPSILEEFNDKSEEIDTQNAQDANANEILQNNNSYEAPGLIDYQKKNQSNNQQQNTNNDDKALNQSVINTNNNTNNNTTITEEPLIDEELQEEFDKKIEDLFKGNTLYDSNISDPVLNYDWITVQPKSTTNTGTNTGTPSTSNTSNTSTEDTDNTSESGSENSGANSKTNGSLSTGWRNGQYYIDGKIYLSNEYINSLTPSQAWGKYISGKNTYREGTLNRLRARALWQKIL